MHCCGNPFHDVPLFVASFLPVFSVVLSAVLLWFRRSKPKPEEKPKEYVTIGFQTYEKGPWEDMSVEAEEAISQEIARDEDESLDPTIPDFETGPREPVSFADLLKIEKDEL